MRAGLLLLALVAACGPDYGAEHDASDRRLQHANDSYTLEVFHLGQNCARLDDNCRDGMTPAEACRPLLQNCRDWQAKLKKRAAKEAD